MNTRACYAMPAVHPKFAFLSVLKVHTAATPKCAVVHAGMLEQTSMNA